MKRDAAKRKSLACYWVAALMFFLAGSLAAEDFTPEQLQAVFYFDLGPAQIDVSGYPKEQQGNYRIFAEACSLCHTLARPINSPISKKEDWSRYIRRMHFKSEQSGKPKISKQDAKAILSFLVYDSRLRKITQSEQFLARSKELQELFERVKAERSRRQIEKGNRDSRPSAPYTGTKP